MADGFHTKDIGKLDQICCQFLGKKITIRKTINTKLKNMFYEYTYLVTIHKYTLKNLPLTLFCHVYYHQKAKYYKHITIQQLDSTC